METGAQNSDAGGAYKDFTLSWFPPTHKIYALNSGAHNTTLQPPLTDLNTLCSNYHTSPVDIPPTSDSSCSHVVGLVSVRLGLAHTVPSPSAAQAPEAGQATALPLSPVQGLPTSKRCYL